MNIWLIIAAAGDGTRMQSNEPKQFAQLLDKPVIIYSLEKFKKVFPDIKIVVSIQKQHYYWFDKNKHLYNILNEVRLSEGGITRFESVKKALNMIDEDGFVAIHDAVRPLITENLIRKLFEKAFSHGNSIPAIALKESIRKIENNQSFSLHRNEYRLIQTPQIFRINQLKNAYNKANCDSYTDDASVMDAAGYHINLVEGEESNIKLTYPIDFQLARLLF